jgi:hypothetical protein
LGVGEKEGLGVGLAVGSRVGCSVGWNKTEKNKQENGVNSNIARARQPNNEL